VLLHFKLTVILHQRLALIRALNLVYGSLFIHMGLFSYIWVSFHTYGSLFIHMGLFSYIWVSFMGLLSYILRHTYEDIYRLASIQAMILIDGS